MGETETDQRAARFPAHKARVTNTLNRLQVLD